MSWDGLWWVALVAGVMFFGAVGMWFYIIHTGWSRLEDSQALSREVSALRAEVEALKGERQSSVPDTDLDVLPQKKM
jgi:hypothetical protein